MSIERGDASGGNGAKAAKAGGFLGSLKDALMAASRDETAPAAAAAPGPGPGAAAPVPPKPAQPEAAAKDGKPIAAAVAPANASPSAEEAARLARATPAPVDRHVEFDGPPTTRVVRREVAEKAAPQTVLVRGRQKIERATFEQDPVVGFLIVVGGPGLGSHRPIFEGNNTVGRSGENRIPLNFGDDSISGEAQAYIRYDSVERSFLFVPNLAKTNVVSLNEKRPTGAVELKPMDVITLGRTQVAFVPFCGPEFDWSEISESKD